MSGAEAYKKRLEAKYGKKSVTGLSLMDGHALTGHSSKVACIAFGPNRNALASASWDKTVRVWDVDSGSSEILQDAGMSTVHSLAISPQGTRLICGSEDKMIRVWDLETKKIAHTVYPTDKSSLGERSYRGPFNPDGHAGTVTCLAYSPDGSRFVSGSYDRMIKVWDAEGKHLYTLPPSAGWHSSESLGWKGYTGPFNPEGHSSCVDSVQFSASGSKLLSASFDRTIKVWDSVTGSMLTAIHPESRASYASGGLDPEGHTEAVTCAVFSPDESKIISGSDDYTVRAWDARSGKRLSILYPSEGPSTFTSDDPHIPYDGQTNRHGHASKVTSLAFSPCGGYFISSGEDRTVRAWNAASFENIFVTEFDRAVACVAISKDGVRMAVGSYDNTVRVYNVERS